MLSNQVETACDPIITTQMKTNQSAGDTAERCFADWVTTGQWLTTEIFLAHQPDTRGGKQLAGMV